MVQRALPVKGRWPLGRQSCPLRCRPQSLFARSASTHAVGRPGSVEHVPVQCKSSGSIIVSLYNVAEHAPTKPLLLYLPPAPQPRLEDEAGPLVAPPEFLLRQGFPVAAIRYRWSAAVGQACRPGPGQGATAAWAGAGARASPPSQLWPTPLHDVLFAYDWVKKHLSPPLSASDPARSPDGRRHHLRRDLYVYGARLGAGLAAALALTETYPQQRVAIRGVAAYNGIYNWTAFVSTTADGIPVADAAAAVQSTVPGTPALPALFCRPSDLFDPFASPSLFFRTPGHLLPPVDFDRAVSRRRTEEAEARIEEGEARQGEAAATATTTTLSLDTARTAYLGFPPLRSALCIPSALFLHSSPPPPQAALVPGQPKRPHKTATATSSRPLRRIPEAVNGHNSFAVQADELACLMRRSIDKVEAKRRHERQPVLLPEYKDSRAERESDADMRSSESEQRVRRADVGAAPGPDSRLELDEDGQEMLLDWLDEHMGGHFAVAKGEKGSSKAR